MKEGWKLIDYVFAVGALILFYSIVGGGVMLWFSL